MNTIETLNALSAKHSNCSDYRLAKILNCSRQTVSMWRTAHRTMDDNYRIMAAKLLNHDPAIHLMYGELERAKCNDLKHAWQSAIKRLTATAAAFILGLSLFLAPAQPATASPFFVTNNIHYAQLYSYFVGALHRFFVIMRPLLTIIKKRTCYDN